MPRLIDADALFESIRFDREAAKVYPQEMCERFSLFCDYAEAVVKEAPTIDAEPVRHGRWINVREMRGETYGTCSRCGTERARLTSLRKIFEAYCLDCGAKMDVEVQDD